MRYSRAMRNIGAIGAVANIASAIVFPAYAIITIPAAIICGSQAVVWDSTDKLVKRHERRIALHNHYRAMNQK